MTVVSFGQLILISTKVHIIIHYFSNITLPQLLQNFVKSTIKHAIFQIYVTKISSFEKYRLSKCTSNGSKFHHIPKKILEDFLKKNILKPTKQPK